MVFFSNEFSYRSRKSLEEGTSTLPREITIGKKIIHIKNKIEIDVALETSKGVSAGYETFVIVYPTLTFI